MNSDRGKLLVHRCSVLVVLGFVGVESVATGQSHFQRADCNQDGTVGITDPVHLLQELFVGAVGLQCRDACDANDDGNLDISDVTYSLSYLFVGGEAPSSPFSSWDADPTEDSLGCKEQIDSLSGVIAKDETWSADRTYQIVGVVRVLSGATLHIEAGTTILGAGPESVLIVDAGARLIAEGTANQPVVFTSSRAPGERHGGDWGGVLIFGRAPTNHPTGIEPSVVPCFLAGRDDFGGLDLDDTSGLLGFVRIEFAGAELCPNNVLAGLSLYAVGAGTALHHLQVKSSGGDSLAIIGGTVDVKHLLVDSNQQHKGMDVISGWRGRGQFLVAQNREESTNNGAGRARFEFDNLEDDFEAIPRTLPVISNATIIGGPVGQRPPDGALVRRGSGIVLANSIIGGFDRGLKVQGCSTACLSRDQLSISGNVVFDSSTAFSVEAVGCGCPDAIESLQELLSEANTTAEEVVLTAPYERVAPDFTPIIETTPDFSILDPSFFEQVGYAGAVAPEELDTDWTRETWVSLAPR